MVCCWGAVGPLVHYQAQHSAQQCSEMLVQRQTFWLAGKALLTCWPASFVTKLVRLIVLKVTVCTLLK